MLGTVLAFDIETVPDVEGGRRLYGLDGLSDEDVARAMMHKRMQAKGTDFMPLHLHRAVAISVTLRHKDQIKVWTVGEADESEAQIIQRFYDGIERYLPTLVSWNGGGFDLPVLHYRGLIGGVTAAQYWDWGDNDRDFKWNNYLSRYHSRHIDLMDVLAMYQARANAPLEEMAVLMGFPGKMGMHGSKVWQAYQAGEIEAIRNYCETDALNTYLLYLRFCQMRGLLDQAGLAQEEQLVHEALQASGADHLLAFDEAWRQGKSGAGGEG